MKITLSTISIATGVASLICHAEAAAFSGTGKASTLNGRQTACSTHDGVATFFCSGTSSTQTTACGNTFDPNSPGVAISTALISDSDQHQTLAPIIDLCATCDEGQFQLDLSPASFAALGGDADCNQGGQLNINWFLEDGSSASCF
ncbi:hypothetical protein NA57DRAFT_52701 [Rhizodiscina lignyota]|uniref:Uncharacterized protein n=1 Tax=Rhizodiscina lignyota TaxID=1504668 RepID=A0A9P4IRY2_9PEZI|nr:hypothetical protein NA57DRAFT_52701 [Rhizodiscina lignyota]